MPAEIHAADLLTAVNASTRFSSPERPERETIVHWLNHYGICEDCLNIVQNTAVAGCAMGLAEDGDVILSIRNAWLMGFLSGFETSRVAELKAQDGG